MIIFKQAEPTTVWEITHNLGSHPTISVSSFVQGVEQMIYPKTVEQVSVNVARVTFSTATAGVAVVREGAYVHNQTEPSAEWIVTHKLDCSPVVQVYIDYDGILQRIIPQAIVFNDDKQLTVLFSSPRTGIVIAH